MLKKSFISLVFTPSKLQFLQLASNKKKVKKFGSVDLPGGIIANYSVKDEKSLTEITKNAWQKLKFKERSVGIVIPEFSTITKNIVLPKIDTSDLDEAVRWEAQEMLPWKTQNTILDWKIISEDKESYSIILVAVKKDLLSGYINATAAAGLFPVVVETPSLSLTRVANTNDKGKLIIYNSFGESVLIVAEGEKIIGSSVVPSVDMDELVRTSIRILNHYKKLKVEKVKVGGQSITDALIKSLSQNLKRSVEPINYQISDFPKDKIHEYLIPISLQLKDAEEPADESTVNLLPPEWVKKYRRSKLKLQTWTLTLLTSYVVWVCFFASLGVYLYLGQQVAQFRQSSSNLAQANPKSVKLLSEIQDINKVSQKVLAISKSTVLPQPILNSIESSRPGGIFVESYKINLDNGLVSVAGISQTRESLLEFKQKLEGVEEFSLVDIPISNFEEQKNLVFSMSFNYLPIVAKKDSGEK